MKQHKAPTPYDPVKDADKKPRRPPPTPVKGK